MKSTIDHLGTKARVAPGGKENRLATRNEALHHRKRLKKKEISPFSGKKTCGYRGKQIEKVCPPPSTYPGGKSTHRLLLGENAMGGLGTHGEGRNSGRYGIRHLQRSLISLAACDKDETGSATLDNDTQQLP